MDNKNDKLKTMQKKEKNCTTMVKNVQNKN